MIIIVGKGSNLSRALSSKFKKSILVSTKNAIDDIKKIDLGKNEKITIIFNNFQKSTLLYNLDNPVDYFQRSIMTTVEVLNFFIINKMKINKVIYTSSSSVYGNNVFCNEKDTLIPSSLHGSLKVSNEKLIEGICSQYKIDYTICRLFNMYGGNDEFSIIHKIIKAAKTNDKLTIFNNGNAIRDFIHIDDVVSIYTKLVKVNSIRLINIGTSNGLSLKNILDYLYNKNIVISYNTKQKDELKTSTADTSILNSFININFKDVKDYIYNEVLNGK